MVQGGKGCVRERGGTRWRRREVGQGRGEGLGGMQELVRTGGDGQLEGVWKPGEGIGDAFGSRLAGPHAITAVMAKCWAKVPTRDGMWGPGPTYAGLFMNEDFHPGRC